MFGKYSKIFFFCISGCSLIIGCESNTKQKENAYTIDPATSATADTTSNQNIDPLANKGIGPVKELKLEAINPKLAEEGKLQFDTKCASCHKMDTKYVGPALKGITQRRSPEWIMNMILNPTEMTEKDPIAKKMLAEYISQMTYQGVKEDEARAILEYFRQEDGK